VFIFQLLILKVKNPNVLTHHK